MVLLASSACVKVMSVMRDPHYTLEEANAQLPWLEETFARLDPLREELASRQNELLELIRLRGGNGAATREQEVAEAQSTVEALTRQLQQALQEVTEKGIIVRDPGRGLVDFLSQLEGREIYLCWLRGEEQIGFWHGTDEGFGSRKAL